MIKVNSWNSTNSWSPCFNLLNKQMTQTNRYTLSYLHMYKYLSIFTYIRMLYTYMYVHMYVYNYLCNVFVVQRKINKAQWYVWLINFRKNYWNAQKFDYFFIFHSLHCTRQKNTTYLNKVENFLFFSLISCDTMWFSFYFQLYVYICKCVR